MKKILLILPLLLGFLVMPADAGTISLKNDSIVCENEANLKILSEDDFVNKPGSTVLKGAKAYQDFYAIKARASKILKDEAEKEESIMMSHNLSSASATARAATYAKEEESNIGISKQFTDFLAHCMAIKESQTAEIIEDKPISKIAKIKTLISDKFYELWTIDFYLNR